MSVLLLAAGALVIGSGPLSCAQRAAGWRPETFPKSVRERLHVSAERVPAYPMEDKRLLEPSGWPDSMEIAGVSCVRRIHAWDDDDAVALATLEEAEPEHRLMLFYDHAASEWNFASAGWGPRYTWNPKGQLMQRIWYEPDSTRLVTHDYTYYSSGRLLGYSWRSEPRVHATLSGKPYEYFSEFFDKDGALIAFGYEKMNGSSRDSLYAWRGSAVPYDQFRMKMHVLYSSAHPGDR